MAAPVPSTTGAGVPTCLQIRCSIRQPTIRRGTPTLKWVTGSEADPMITIARSLPPTASAALTTTPAARWWPSRARILLFKMLLPSKNHWKYLGKLAGNFSVIKKMPWMAKKMLSLEAIWEVLKSRKIISLDSPKIRRFFNRNLIILIKIREVLAMLNKFNKNKTKMSEFKL